jgi:hypothetical protein
MILSPDTNGSVPATGSKVVAERTPFHLPNRTFMAFINDKAGPSLERPEADCAVGRTGEKESRVGGWSILVGIGGAFDGGGEGNLVDRARVSDEAARAGWWIIQGRSDLRGKRIAVKVPDSDIRLLGANSDKVIIIGELDTGDAKR